MIKKETLLRVVDNSGVKSAKCIGLLASSKNPFFNIFVVSVKKLHKKKLNSKIKSGDIFYAILIRANNFKFKVDSQSFRFFENSVVLINKNFKPIGTRVIGPVLKSFRQLKLFKLISISSGVLW